MKYLKFKKSTKSNVCDLVEEHILCTEKSLWKHRKTILENNGKNDILCQVLSERLIKYFFINQDKTCYAGDILYQQELSFKFVKKYISFFSQYDNFLIKQNFTEKQYKKLGLSDQTAKLYTRKINVKFSGRYMRSIWIDKDEYLDRKIINVGCFEGTKKEAIKRINDEYADEPKHLRKQYIHNVKKCFKLAKMTFV